MIFIYLGRVRGAFWFSDDSFYKRWWISTIHQWRNNGSDLVHPMNSSKQSVTSSWVSEMHKNTVIECANLRIKKILNSSYLIFKLEQRRVEVESIARRVKVLKSEDIFFDVLDLESGDERLKEDNVYGDEMNRSNASKLLSKIENPWLMVKN